MGEQCPECGWQLHRHFSGRLACDACGLHVDAPPPAPKPAWTDDDVATWIDLRPDERLDVEDLASGARRTLPIRVANRLVRRGILSPLLRHDRVRLKGSRRYYAFVDLTDKGKRVAAYGASLREGSR